MPKATLWVRHRSPVVQWLSSVLEAPRVCQNRAGSGTAGPEGSVGGSPPNTDEAGDGRRTTSEVKPGCPREPKPDSVGHDVDHDDVFEELLSIWTKDGQRQVKQLDMEIMKLM